MKVSEANKQIEMVEENIERIASFQYKYENHINPYEFENVRFLNDVVEQLILCKKLLKKAIECAEIDI